MNDELGKRMKTYYETIPKTKLMRKIPVAIRIDGKAFHTFTRGLNKPFDDILTKSMQQTMKYLCENIQGCVLGYTQSDEITLILVDYKQVNSCAWFDYEVQKMCSVAASMATMAFNNSFTHNILEYQQTHLNNGAFSNRYFESLIAARDKGAMFDARCFNVPKEEVTNLIYWRQLDAIRNSVQMVGQAYFGHAELQGKSCNDIQDMLIQQKGIDWNKYAAHQKRGSACIKETYTMDNPDSSADPIIRNRWVIDMDIPIFKDDDRDYIEQRIIF